MCSRQNAPILSVMDNILLCPPPASIWELSQFVNSKHNYPIGRFLKRAPVDKMLLIFANFTISLSYHYNYCYQHCYCISGIFHIHKVFKKEKKLRLLRDNLLTILRGQVSISLGILGSCFLLFFTPLQNSVRTTASETCQ